MDPEEKQAMRRLSHQLDQMITALNKLAHAQQGMIQAQIAHTNLVERMNQRWTQPSGSTPSADVSSSPEPKLRSREISPSTGLGSSTASSKGSTP